MTSPAGSTQAPSTMQSCLADFAHLAQRMPTVTVERTIDLGKIAAVRGEALPRPSWLAVFTKAVAFVAGAHPELCQAWVLWPRPHLYRHPFAVAAVLVERQLDDQMPYLWGRVRNPAQLGLQQIDGHLQRFKEDAPELLGQVRRQLARNRWPWPLRRLAWMRDTLLSGSRRARHLGTFAVASLGGLGAELVDPLYPASAVLTYGTIQNGVVSLRLKFDARLLTPGCAARILQDVERALSCELVLELQYFQKLAA